MFSSVCRICLQDGELFSLYDKAEGADLTFSEKIMQVTYINLVSCTFPEMLSVDAFPYFQEKKSQNLPEHICSACVGDLEASYRFKMNCESSDAILQSYIVPTATSDVFSEASENEEEIISEVETENEMPVDESDLYNYQSQMYDENGEMIGEEDNLENALEVSLSLKAHFKPFLIVSF